MAAVIALPMAVKYLASTEEFPQCFGRSASDSSRALDGSQASDSSRALDGSQASGSSRALDGPQASESSPSLLSSLKIIVVVWQIVTQVKQPQLYELHIVVECISVMHFSLPSFALSSLAGLCDVDSQGLLCCRKHQS